MCHLRHSQVNFRRHSNQANLEYGQQPSMGDHSPPNFGHHPYLNNGPLQLDVLVQK
jgi:hypothetical protein